MDPVVMSRAGAGSEGSRGMVPFGSSSPPADGLAAGSSFVHAPCFLPTKPVMITVHTGALSPNSSAPPSPGSPSSPSDSSDYSPPPIMSVSSSLGSGVPSLPVLSLLPGPGSALSLSPGPGMGSTMATLSPSPTNSMPSPKQHDINLPLYGRSSCGNVSPFNYEDSNVPFPAAAPKSSVHPTTLAVIADSSSDPNSPRSFAAASPRSSASPSAPISPVSPSSSASAPRVLPRQHRLPLGPIALAPAPSNPDDVRRAITEFFSSFTTSDSSSSSSVASVSSPPSTVAVGPVHAGLLKSPATSASIPPSTPAVIPVTNQSNSSPYPLLFPPAADPLSSSDPFMYPSPFMSSMASGSTTSSPNVSPTSTAVATATGGMTLAPFTSPPLHQQQSPSPSAFSSPAPMVISPASHPPPGSRAANVNASHHSHNSTDTRFGGAVVDIDEIRMAPIDYGTFSNQLPSKPSATTSSAPIILTQPQQRSPIHTTAATPLTSTAHAPASTAPVATYRPPWQTSTVPPLSSSIVGTATAGKSNTLYQKAHPTSGSGAIVLDRRRSEERRNSNRSSTNSTGPRSDVDIEEADPELLAFHAQIMQNEIVEERARLDSFDSVTGLEIGGGSNIILQQEVEEKNNFGQQPYQLAAAAGYHSQYHQQPPPHPPISDYDYDYDERRAAAAQYEYDNMVAVLASGPPVGTSASEVLTTALPAGPGFATSGGRNSTSANTAHVGNINITTASSVLVSTSSAHAQQLAAAAAAAQRHTQVAELGLFPSPQADIQFSSEDIADQATLFDIIDLQQTKANLPPLDGFLFKQASKQCMEVWQKRFVMMSEFHLYYSKSQIYCTEFELSSATSIVDLPIREISDISSNKFLKDKLRFSFTAREPKSGSWRSYEFRASTEAERAYWEQGLTAHKSCLEAMLKLAAVNKRFKIENLT